MRLFPLLACLVLSPAAAQEPAARGTTVRFVAQAIPAGMTQVVMKTREKKSKPFDLPMNNLTEPLEVPARAFTLALAGRETAIGRVALPEKGSAFVVLLLAVRADGYDPVVLPASDPAFRPGDIYLHNTSDTPILGQIGDSRFTLASGKGRVHKPSGAVDETYYDIAFAIREESGRNRFLTTSRWPVTDRTRSYVFFYNDPTTKRVKFRAVDEFIPLARPDR